jgi:hypothetical protein
MVEVDNAAVTWDAQKKRWVIRLQVGAEVIKRPALKTAHDADEDLLRTVAVKIAQDEGYYLNSSTVTVAR